MRRIVRKHTLSSNFCLGLTALGLLLAGCSDASPEPDDSALTGDATVEPSADVDEYGLLSQEALDADEAQALRDYFESQQWPSEDVSFFGRLIALQGDMLVPADDLLPQAFALGSAASELEKGRVPTQLSLGSRFPNCPTAVCGDSAPFQFAFGTRPPGNLAWRRPDVSKTYYLTVANDAPAFFTTTPAGSVFPPGGLIKLVADRIQPLSGDCIPSSMFVVLRDSAYDALATSTKEANYRIRVVAGAFGSVCANSAVGCSNFPRLASVKVNGVSTQRLRFGDRIALVTQALVQPTTALVELNAYSLGIATHELLHTMGFGHPEVSGGEEQPVPGTATGTTHLSIMHAFTTGDPNYRNTLQSDDLAVMTKLYAGSCNYSDFFRLLTP